MSRVVREDFSQFTIYLSKFSFAGLLSDAAYISELKAAHGKLLALSALVAELRHEAGAAASTFSVDYTDCGGDYLGEVLSDCSESLMCIAMGANRAGAAALRSAIESFAKTFSIAEQPSVLTRTSVPEVFSVAAGCGFFEHNVARNAFTSLRSSYADLNQFVHTVSSESMFAVLAVGNFPKYDANTAVMVENFVRVVRYFILAMVAARRDLYDQFDHRNKEVIAAALKRDQRRIALG